MNKMVYVYYNYKENCLYITGVSIDILFETLSTSMNNLLILSGFSLEDSFSGFDFNTFCEYTSKEHFDLFKRELSAGYSNLTFIDFEDRDSLKLISKREIADLLYLAKMNNPVETPFVENLGNKCAFVSLDDGAYNKIYLKSFDMIKPYLENVLSLKSDSLISVLHGGCVLEEVEPNIYSIIAKNTDFMKNSDEVETLFLSIKKDNLRVSESSSNE